MEYVGRYLPIWSLANERLAPKMIFIAGPRQAGKTTLVKQFLAEKGCSDLFYNWDTPAVKKLYRGDPSFFESQARLLRAHLPDIWVALDEIHKRTRWKDMLKGYYDQFSDEFRFIISGSARLDLFRKTGDALIGRYFLFTLLPLSLSELGGTPFDRLAPWHHLAKTLSWQELPASLAAHPPLPYDLWEHLFTFGPFPEPLLKADNTFSSLWHQDYLALYLREEIRDLTRISDIDGVEMLASMLLPARIGSVLSINSLKEDLHASHATIRGWLDSLVKLYLIFALSPGQKKIHRSITKEKKYYFMDWSYIPTQDLGQRFENMIAVGLQRLCLQLTENGAGRHKLYFVRDLARREVDFLIARDETPVVLVEAKVSELKVSGFAVNLAKKLGDIPIIQLVHMPGVLKKITPTAWVISACHFFSGFP